MSVNRRAFLGGLGGIVAVASLPSVGADDPAVFPSRGDFERLALAYQHVHIGLERPFSVLHISDTHFTSAYPDEDAKKQKLREVRTRTFGGRQEEALRDSLAWAKKNVDYVVHTGDLIDWQSRANFDLVKKYFGEGMFGSLGNHEFSPSMWLEKDECSEAHKAKSRTKLSAAYPFDIELQSTVVNGVNFVAIDDVYGYMTARQVERFAAEVKKGLPIVLCMHVPFITDEIWRAGRKFWRANRKYTSAVLPDAKGDFLRQNVDVVTRDFIAYLKKEPLLKAILAGHLHITVQERFSPTAMQYVVGGNFMFHGQEVLFT
ncbi:MAG: metallophosphoesterase family protein [Kiritimatiellia bacterium]